MEELAISGLVKHVGTLGLAGVIIITFFWGAISLFRKIAVQFFAQNEKSQEYNLKMLDGVNELAKIVQRGNIYMEEGLSEIKNDISKLATSEQVMHLQKMVDVIFRAVDDIKKTTENLNFDNKDFKEKLSEIKNDILKIANSEQIANLQEKISLILEKVKDLENKS